MTAKLYRMALAIVMVISFTSYSFAGGKSEATMKSLCFDTVFTDSTLRIDYTLTGGGGRSVEVALRDLHKFSKWAGRRVNFKHPPYLADGVFTLRDLVTGDTIYSTSFSTLFHEWLETEEAQITPHAMDHVVICPMPRRKVTATMELRNSKRCVISTLTHTVDPADMLISPKKNSLLSLDNVIDLHIAGTPDSCIDIAIISDGYTHAEVDTFISQARRATTALLNHEPFASMADRLNIRALFIPSRESGVSIPRVCKWVDTPFASHFSTFYLNRYLSSPAITSIHDALSGIPYEHIIVLANTNEYGGGGIFNLFTLTAGGNDLMEPVVVHEFGHSFGGLGDEYFYESEQNNTLYPPDVEPWNPNITTMVDFASKWQRLIPEGTPLPAPESDADKYPLGLYMGADYNSHVVWRPSASCRMRDNKCVSFCEACVEALRSIILYYTEQISE